jgi:ribosomal protein L7/L12
METQTMATGATDKYQIILEKVPEEKQPETALFLSGCFSLPRASTRGIAASGPIAILSDLQKGQAEAILAELRTSLPEGVEIVAAAQGERARVSRLQWPHPPKVYGSAIDEFALQEEEPHDIKCPICGGNIRITQDERGMTAAIAGERRRGDTVFRSAPVPAPETDKDPVFAGVKPLAAGTGNYASIRSLQAGDTGWWKDHIHGAFVPPPEEPPPSASGTRHGRGGTSGGAKKSGGKSSAGLAAFMKPGTFAVIVGRTKDAATVKMIAEIMGVGESDARDKCLDLGLCVARDISLDEAQTLLTRFRNLGAKARIVKPS